MGTLLFHLQTTPSLAWVPCPMALGYFLMPSYSAHDFGLFLELLCETHFFLTHTQLFGSSNTWKSFFSMRCIVWLDIWTQRLLLSKLFMKSGVYPEMTCTGWHNYFPSTFVFLCFSKVKIWAHAHLLLLSSFQSSRWKYRFMIFLVRL